MLDHEQETEHLNSDIKLIHEWSLKWKMIFNPDVNKPAVEIPVITWIVLLKYPQLVIFLKHVLWHFLRFLLISYIGVDQPVGVKYLTRLRVGLRHLRAHKFKHNLQDITHPFCLCKGIDVECVEHYHLHFQIHASCRSVLFKNLVYNISLVALINPKFTCDILMYGDPIYKLHTNKMITLATIQLLILTTHYTRLVFPFIYFSHLVTNFEILVWCITWSPVLQYHCGLWTGNRVGYPCKYVVLIYFHCLFFSPYCWQVYYNCLETPVKNVKSDVTSA